MITLKEICDYIDEIIDAEAGIPKGASHQERAIATGIILSMEDFKDWLKGNWDREKVTGFVNNEKI